MPISSRRRDAFKCLSALVLFALVFPGAASERSTNEHWTAVQAHLGKNAGLTAHRVATRFELPDDDGPLSGTYTTIVRSISPNGEAVRELETDTKEGQLGMKMAPLGFGFGNTLANHPERMFASIDSVQLSGTEQRGGMRWHILEVRSRLSKGNAAIRAKIWVDEQTGRVLEMNGVIEKSPLPGVNAVNFSVRYALNDEGLSLPKKVTVAYTISIFHRTGTAKFVHELGGWARREVKSAEALRLSALRKSGTT